MEHEIGGIIRAHSYTMGWLSKREKTTLISGHGLVILMGEKLEDVIANRIHQPLDRSNTQSIDIPLSLSRFGFVAFASPTLRSLIPV
jgi:hypothetical protein